MEEKTYFKDIYEYLSNLYPNRNIFVLSDEILQTQNKR